MGREERSQRMKQITESREQRADFFIAVSHTQVSVAMAETRASRAAAAETKVETPAATAVVMDTSGDAKEEEEEEAVKANITNVSCSTFDVSSIHQRCRLLSRSSLAAL
jgi:hypothetical protein